MTRNLCLTAAVATLTVIAIVIGRVGAEADEKRRGDASATADSAEPAAEPANGDETADPLAIPEGPPEEVLKSLVQVARTPSRSVEELQQKCRAIVRGADQILAAKPDEDVAIEAVDWQFSALDALARYGDADARRRLAERVKELKGDPRPRVASIARRYDLQLRAPSMSEAAADAQQAFLDEVFAYFETNDVSQGDLGIMLATGMALADSGNTELAQTAYRRFLLLATRSDDPQVRSLGRNQFKTMLERLELMGQTLEVAGETLDGKKFDLEDYRGKVVLVDFWATWCGPCVAEMPNLKEQYAKYRDRGFEIVGVNVDRSRDAVERFLEDARLPWTNLFDNDPRYEEYGHPVAARYEIAALPTLLLLDRTGKVVSVTASGPRLSKWLDKLLAEGVDAGTAERR